MEITLETVVFYFLAAFIAVFSILTVTTNRIVRAATYLLFVLFGTAGLYFLLGYTFLGSVQIMVYAGGVVVLYVFSIFLTSGEGAKFQKLKKSRFWAASVTLMPPGFVKNRSALSISSGTSSQKPRTVTRKSSENLCSNCAFSRRFVPQITVMEQLFGMAWEICWTKCSMGPHPMLPPMTSRCGSWG